MKVTTFIKNAVICTVIIAAFVIASDDQYIKS